MSEEKDALKEKKNGKAEAAAATIQMIKEGRASLHLKLAAAQGKFPLKIFELLDLLFLLRNDTNPQVREAVIKTARSLPQDQLIKLMDTTLIKPEMLDFLARVSLGRDAILQRIILDSSSLDNTIEYLAKFAHEELLKIIATDKLRIKRHPTILNAMLNNKNASQSVKEALLKEEKESEKEVAESQEESTKNLIQRIAELNVAQKVMLGLKGSWQERVILLRDRNKQVAGAVLKSPKLNDKEVERISRMRNVPDEVLRGISENRRWTSKYAVILNLVENPKTPVSQSLSFVSRLSNMDLRRLRNNRDVPEAVRKLGKRILEKRTAPSKTSFGRH